MHDSLHDTQQSQQQIQLFPVQHHQCWCFFFTCHSFCPWEQPAASQHHAPVGPQGPSTHLQCNFCGVAVPTMQSAFLQQGVWWGAGGRQQLWVTPLWALSLQPSLGSAARGPAATGAPAGRRMASTTAPAPTASPASTARSVQPPPPQGGQVAAAPPGSRPPCAPR